MRTGLLRGRDHTLLGAIAALAERRVAIALSRGGAAKNYDYRDPNEDACGFAFTDQAWLIAVADGHWGSGGAELAIERLLERHAPRWTAPSTLLIAERWHSEAPDAVFDLHSALLAEGSEAPIGRTTLAVALARPSEGWWAAFAIGDSHVFSIEAGRATEVCAAQPKDVVFVGDATLDRDRIARSTRTSLERRTSGSIVLATDGLSETDIGVRDPAVAVSESALAASAARGDLAPLAAARGLAERALAAQRRNASGDNVATACIWLDA